MLFLALYSGHGDNVRLADGSFAEAAATPVADWQAGLAEAVETVIDGIGSGIYTWAPNTPASLSAGNYPFKAFSDSSSSPDESPESAGYLDWDGHQQINLAAVIAAIGSGGGGAGGDNSVQVDHNYGGIDVLRITTAAGAGIDNVTIRAYLTSDYVAGQRSADYIVASTRTSSDGRWVNPILLDPDDYTLVIFKQGIYRTTTHNIAVG